MRVHRCHCDALGSQQGAALSIVLGTALAASIAAYAMLSVAVGEARHARAFDARARARHAAEAALVWAQQQLWNDPTWSSAAGATDLTVGGVAVDVILPSCEQLPCEPRRLQTTVIY